VAALSGAAPVRGVVVAGAGPLTFAVIQRLDAARVPVTALLSAPDAAAHAADLAGTGARVVTGKATVADTLRAAGVAEAQALVLADDDDAGNVDAALTARSLWPDLHLVVRLFDPTLARYLGDTLAPITPLSMSSLAAPVFAELATQAMRGPALRQAGVAPAPPDAPPARPRAARLTIDRVLVALMVALAALVVVATTYFSVALRLRPIDALYFVWSTVTTVGYGDIALRDASDAAKVVGMGVMFAGAAFMAVLHALLTDGVVARRLHLLRGLVAERGRGHAVVVGAGNVGVRVAEALAARGQRVVVVERDGESRHLDRLRGAGHHVIVGDALLQEPLRLAGVRNASVVLGLTDSDAVNLHVALSLGGPGGPSAVLRLQSPELSAHVRARGTALAASPVGIASEAFARAALESEGAEGQPRPARS